MLEGAFAVKMDPKAATWNKPYLDPETPETYLINSRYQRGGRAVSDYIDETGATVLQGIALGMLGRVASGLRSASPGLQELYAGGSVANKSIIGIRDTLLRGGFKQSLAKNGAGYLFRSGVGREEVRIMSRGGGWDLRAMNDAGNYLDAFGNVAKNKPGGHGITVLNR